MVAEVYNLAWARHTRQSIEDARQQDELLRRLSHYVFEEESDPSVLGLETVSYHHLLAMSWHLGQYMASLASIPRALTELKEAIEAAMELERQRRMAFAVSAVTGD